MSRIDVVWSFFPLHISHDQLRPLVNQPFLQSTVRRYNEFAFEDFVVYLTADVAFNVTWVYPVYPKPIITVAINLPRRRPTDVAGGSLILTSPFVWNRTFCCTCHRIVYRPGDPSSESIFACTYCRIYSSTACRSCNDGSSSSVPAALNGRPDVRCRSFRHTDQTTLSRCILPYQFRRSTNLRYSAHSLAPTVGRRLIASIQPW